MMSLAPRVVLALLALPVLGACAPERETVELAPAEGPPTFQVEVAARHAAQFEGDELRERPAGSQQEQGAAVYILGVLQRNGYVVRLDGVPVGDLVRSTNVVARAPEHEVPEIVVVTAYDTPRGEAGTGAALGLFLELSRAVSAATPRRAVWFAALGAQHADGSEGGLGARRLVELLLDQGADPLIIRVDEMGAGGPLRVGGPDAERLAAALPEASGPPEAAAGPDVFQEAGLQSAVVSGGIGDAGPALFRFLVASED